MKIIPEHLRNLIGRPVKIIKGYWRGYIGNLKAANDKTARVELIGKSKIVAVPENFVEDFNKEISGNELVTTPKTNLGAATKTPAYYPQSPNLIGGTSPKWNPTTRIFF